MLDVESSFHVHAINVRSIQNQVNFTEGVVFPLTTTVGTLVMVILRAARIITMKVCTIDLLLGEVHDAIVKEPEKMKRGKRGWTTDRLYNLSYPIFYPILSYQQFWIG